jgi:hypothetical protein
MKHPTFPAKLDSASKYVSFWFSEYVRRFAWFGIHNSLELFHLESVEDQFTATLQSIPVSILSRS